MVTIQNRELEALQAKIREAEERLKERESLSSPRSNIGSGRNNRHRRPALAGVFSTGNGEKGHGPSPLSSPISESHPSEGGFMDSSNSATTSSDADESANRDESASENERKGDGKGKGQGP